MKLKVFISYLALVFVWLLPATLSLSSQIVSGPFSDASQALWGMENYELFGSTYSRQAYPPRGTEFGYIHWASVPLVLAKPLLWVFDLVLTYNLMLVLSLTTAAFGAYLLGVSEGLEPHAAWVVGLAYGISPSLAGQVMLGHFFFLVGAAWVPYYLCCFRLFFRGQRPLLTGLGVLVLWVLLLRTCNYFALFLIPTSFVLGIQSVLTSPSRIKQGSLLLLAGVAVSILGVAQTRANSDTELFMPRINVEFYDADLLASITPSPFHPLWGERFERTGDRVGFCGLALILLGLWSFKNQKYSIWFLLMALMWVIALGPVAYFNQVRLFEWPWHRMFSLPGYAGIQVYGRAAIIGQLFLALAAARVLPNKKWSIGVCLVLGFEFWVAPAAVFDTAPSLLLTKLQQRPAGTVATIPYQAANTIPLYHQVLHRHSMLRSPVLRPSPELRDFYADVPIVECFSNLDGYARLPLEVDTFQRLVDLRYLILDKERLGAAHLNGWRQELSRRFKVLSEEENDHYLVLELMPPESKGENHFEINCDSSDRNYCAWGFSRPAESQMRGERSMMTGVGQLWLPMAKPSSLALTVTLGLRESQGGLVYWNGHFVGTVVGTMRRSTTELTIAKEYVTSGANELRIVLQGQHQEGKETLVLDRVSVRELP